MFSIMEGDSVTFISNPETYELESDSFTKISSPDNGDKSKTIVIMPLKKFGLSGINDMKQSILSWKLQSFATWLYVFNFERQNPTYL
ncbi:hypothetical protein GYH30_036728 [Glycine max]|uniref:Uncharacterized protein n=2 Tax=Glycine subgen. Soja TaxID=1462606 RepID=A0A0R0GQW4_SOYBN|nr:hypothetical protein GYH30_036728 [Glycine max]RZB81821.1 hypothetical protein D0Y65_031184 [Glycine soja]